MSWMEEREQLIADTLAFVQRVADEHPAPAIDFESWRVATAAPVPEPIARHPLRQHRLTRAPADDMRHDMVSRVEEFRNRQRLIEIEREAYYQHALQRIRAVTDQWP